MGADVRPSVRPSFRPSVQHVSFPEQNTKTVRDILTKLGTQIGLVVNWCLLIVWDFLGFFWGIFLGFGIFLGDFFLGGFFYSLGFFGDFLGIWDILGYFFYF